jgi:PAS domain S-box-containing protein
MNQDEFQQEFDNIVGRLSTFHRHPAGPPVEGDLLSEAIEELGVALEELRVSEEHLRSQADEAAEVHQLLEDERNRYRDLFELAPIPYLVTDLAGVIREANRRACAALRVQRRFLVGRPLANFLPVDDRFAFRTLLRRLGDGEPHGDVQLHLQPRGGAPLLAGTAVGTVRDAGGRPRRICWAVRTVSLSVGTVGAPREQEPETPRWLALRASDEEPAAPGSSAGRILGVALEEFSQAAATMFGAADAGIMLLDASGELRWLQTLSRYGSAFERAQIRLHEGPCIDAFEEGKPISTTDLSQDDRWPRMRVLPLDQIQVRAVLSAPIDTVSGTIGTCNLLSPESKPWSESDVGAIRAYASALGTLLRVVAEAHSSSLMASQLQHALDQRVVVERAKGILMERESLNPEQAFERLRLTARSSQRRLVDVAAELIKESGGSG